MPCPEMSDFSAWINLQPGSENKLIVVGKVTTFGGNMVPTLTEIVPQGINPSILLLELTIVDTGKPGTKDISPRPVRFEKPASKGQYSQVDISFEDETCLLLDVTEAN